MKLSYPLLLQFLFLFFCAGKNNAAAAPAINHAFVYVPTDSAARSYIASFKAFRDAVYQGDTARLKAFFVFPVKGAEEMWYFLNGEDTTGIVKSTFTESDFSQYYKKIFPPHFTRTILKIKSADLLRNSRAESPAIKEGNTTIKISVEMRKKEKVLVLYLAYNTPWTEDKDGTVLDGGESSIIYTFRILKNNQLQFVKIMMAG